MRRVFLIVLDSVGIGEMPDAALFGDEGRKDLEDAARALGQKTGNIYRGCGSYD